MKQRIVDYFDLIIPNPKCELNYNKDYVVNKISCTCGCMQDDGYCKHVAATLMYIDKTKEFKEE